MTATAQATPTKAQFINMGTAQLVEAIDAGITDAKHELERRAAKGSRFAIKALKRIGANIQPATEPATEPVTEGGAASADEIVAALATAAGEKPSKKK